MQLSVLLRVADNLHVQLKLQVNLLWQSRELVQIKSRGAFQPLLFCGPVKHGVPLAEARHVRAEPHLNELEEVSSAPSSPWVQMGRFGGG